MTFAPSRATGWCLLYIGINALIVVKRALQPAGLPAAAVAACCAAAAVLVALTCWPSGVARVRQAIGRTTPGALLALVATVTLLLAWAQSRIDPLALQVDRWSAIHNFLERLTDGAYPYAARTHLGGYGSPFPVWQLAHWPLYALFRNVGLSSLVAQALFVHSVYRFRGKETATVAALLLYASPAFLYEVMVRSDLTANFLVCATVMNYLCAAHFAPARHPAATGLISGLLLSSRWSVALPLGVLLFIPFVRMRPRAKAVFLVTAAATFTASFLPFLCWDSEMLLFFEYNPFVLQTRQGNAADLLLLVPLALFLGWRAGGDGRRAASAAAVLLTATVAVSFLHDMFVRNDWSEIFHGAYDITYFHMALPFCILTLADRLTEQARPSGPQAPKTIAL